MSELVKLFVEQSGMDFDDLRRIIRTAPDRYKIFEIDKRSGGKREIAQPARELKQLQRILMSSLLSTLPIHPAATAYRKGQSLLHNVVPHAGPGPILKMDFSDFFPSIKSEDWLLYCDANNLLGPEDRDISTRILFRRAKNERLLKLSVGAPSSPLLSNVLMNTFDEALQVEASRRRITYTRYADDLTFSGQRAGMLKDMVKEVERATRRFRSPKLTINADKTTFITSAKKRMVTGVVLSNEGSVGLGHQRKRILSARVHHAVQGRLDKADLRKLTGELAFANVIDPQFLDWLTRKYGAESIKLIKSLKA